jgi:hypothetical protein
VAIDDDLHPRPGVGKSAVDEAGDQGFGQQAAGDVLERLA